MARKYLIELAFGPYWKKIFFVVLLFFLVVLIPLADHNTRRISPPPPPPTPIKKKLRPGQISIIRTQTAAVNIINLRIFNIHFQK